MSPLNPLARFLPSLILIGISYYAKAQNSAQYDLFKRPSIQQILNRNTPQQLQFSPVDLGQLAPRPQIPSILNSGNFIEENNRKLLQQHNMLSGQTNLSPEQIAQIERDRMEIERNYARNEWLKWNGNYQKAFSELDKMYSVDSFSITKAIYLVENAFLDNQIPYDNFLKAIKQRADHVKQLLKTEKLSIKNDLALNYGIQQLYSRQTSYYNPITKLNISVPRLGYDFEDFQGENDYTKMFVSKLMVTSKGQCHSLPLLYLMIAEQLGAKAWLSLAPQHSFIQFPDRNGNLMNFETTNGNIVSTNWLYQSGFINSSALKSKTYLDTLSQKKLFAHCLADLLLGYLDKAAYDEFAEQIRKRILQIEPDNMTALIIDANNKTYLAAARIKSAGRPMENDLPKYPAAYQAYQDMQQAYEKIDGLGYQEMPKEAYQAWLQSIEKAKQKQENTELKEKMQAEIDYLKSIRTTIKAKPKG